MEKKIICEWRTMRNTAKVLPVVSYCFKRCDVNVNDGWTHMYKEAV